LRGKRRGEGERWRRGREEGQGEVIRKKGSPEQAT